VRFEFKPSFGRSLKHLHPREQSGAREAADALMDFYTTGEKTPGLGIDHLRGPFWEARVGLRVRLLYRWQKNMIEFVLAGNHDDVKRFLRRMT
jgi:hypothetical protein